MRIAICVGDKAFTNYFLNCLKEYVLKYRSKIHFDCYSSAEAFLHNLCEYQMIFIEYNLIGKNGISLAREIRKGDKKVLIVFITESTEIAYDVFEVETFRFLPKPLNKATLFHVIFDAYKKLNEDKYIVVKDTDTLHQLRINDIYLVESNRNYCIIRTSKDEIICRDTLTNFISKLPDSLFFRTHRSFLVNLMKVKQFSANEITLENNLVALLSRDRRIAFKTCILSLKNYN